MKICLTGATGHSGRWFIQRLIKEEFDGELVCIVRNGSDITNLESSGLNYSIIWGDLQEDPPLFEAMQGADVLLHIAGIGKSPEVVTAAEKSNIPWIILIHTTGRYSRYKSASAGYIAVEDTILEKRNCELNENATETKFDESTQKVLPVGNVTVARPTMIYGSTRDVNMHKLILYLNKHKFFPLFGRGENLMQPVHARDLGNAYYDIIMNREQTINKEYNLSGKEPIEYRDIINTTSRLLGRKNKIVSIPFGISLLAAKMYNAIFGKKAIISVEQVLRMQEDKAFKYDDAARDFGYAPMGFEEGIREEIDQMKKEGLI